MKVLSKIDSHNSIVELVEIDGEKFILKTANEEEAYNEKRFLSVLKQHDLPSLEILENKDLRENQLLLEYIPNSQKAIHDNAEDMERWGKAVRNIHNIHFEKAFKVTENNVEQVYEWSDFLHSALDSSIERRRAEVSEELLNDIVEFVSARLNIKCEQFSLLHGDLHDGNTLERNGDVILFDKSSEIFAGDPLYDLVIFLTHYPNGTYVQTDNPKYKDDVVLLQHFIKGYGHNFLEDKYILDVYMVIRALDRYTNSFEIFNKEIIENIIYSK